MHFLKQAISFSAALLLVPAPLRAENSPTTKPYIVYILCDDLGYGDVHCLNPDRGKIATPNIDKLARDGMTFTDCHATASVCSPSRYSILTGRYAWRTHLQLSALPGDAPPLIASRRLTVAELLKQHGYATAAIGKWHLGLGLGQEPYREVISDGPLNHGFDYFYGISASADLPPFDYIENDRFVAEPTVTKDWGTRAWGASGPATQDFDWGDLVPNLTRRAVSYIESRSVTDQPFFLYLALTSPHTPLVPTPTWQGKSGLGDYGDFVMETDWAVGEVLTAIEKTGIAADTFVEFTSDNGCAPYIDIASLEAAGHFPSGALRGYKFDIWDGGHRVPFIVRWPARVPGGTRCDQLVCLSDFMATCADVVKAKLPDDAGEDSVSLLTTMLGKSNRPIHKAIVQHSTRGYFAVRCDQWKLNLCAGSGGWAGPSEDELRRIGAPGVQLYDMKADVGELHNLENEHSDIVRRLLSVLETYVAQGRSTPGPALNNDVPVDVWKSSPPSVTTHKDQGIAPAAE